MRDRYGPPDEIAAKFRDESGHRRATDPYLVAAALSIVPGHPSLSVGSAPESTTPDLELWRALFHVDIAPDRHLAVPGTLGPLLRHAESTTIEVLTESDLSGMHAAWTVARLHRRADLARRCFEAAHWHAAELQPDNATQSPWAIHIFVALGALFGESTMLVEAETRLHTCLVLRGQPDRRSALILHHASSELTTLAEAARNDRVWFQTV